MSEPRLNANQINDNALDKLYKEIDRLREQVVELERLLESAWDSTNTWHA